MCSREKLETIYIYIYVYTVVQVGGMFHGDLGRAQGFESGILGRYLTSGLLLFGEGGLLLKCYITVLMELD